jgi:hypothetical protein
MTPWFDSPATMQVESNVSMGTQDKDQVDTGQSICEEMNHH